MKLENQVCTLGQAKRLKELGIEEHSVVLWLDYSKNPHGPKLVWFDVMEFEKARHYIYPAFTVAELGAMLPDGTAIGGAQILCYRSSPSWISRHPGARLWVCELPSPNEGDERMLVECQADTEAEARTALLIHLLETSRVTAGEVNQRLNETLTTKSQSL